jgi:hypothetical protein
MKFLLYTLLFVSVLSFRPADMDSSTENNESYLALQDSTIKTDLAFFTVTGSASAVKNNLPKAKLGEISPWYCSDSSISFYKGNIIAADKSIYIHTTSFDTAGHKLLYADGKLKQIDGKTFWGTNGEIPKKKISHIDMVRGEYRDTELPPVAFEDLYEPVTCSGYVKTGMKRSKPQSNCKVYQTEDHHIVYIYMRNADYEVTWVLKGGKYLQRVVDKL